MLSDRWRLTQIGSCGELRNGVNFNQGQEGIGLPVLKVKDFKDRFFARLEGLDELDSQKIAVPLDQLLADGDTVIIRSNGNGQLVGRCLFVTNTQRPVTFSGFCIRFRPDRTRIDPRFASYLLRSSICRDRFVAYGSGTGIQNLNQATISHAEIELPPAVQQQAIARILGALDDKIELNRQMNATLEAMARALFKSWFVDFDPVAAKAAGRKPFGMTPAAAALFPDRFVDSDLGPIPKGWQVSRVPDAFEVNPNRKLERGCPAPYLDMQNMPTDASVPAAWIERSCGSGMRFMNGDTLLARITPCLENGKTAHVNFLEPGQIGWGSTEYIVLRSKPPLPLEYSYFLARDDDFRAFAIANMTGSSGRQRVPASCLVQYLLVVPDKPIATAFARVVSPVMNRVRQNADESRTLAALRDALLPKLLSGEIRLGRA